jgi:hypothetical protein
MNNVGHKPSRYLRNRKREYLKDNINELARNGRGKNMATCIEE